MPASSPGWTGPRCVAACPARPRPGSAAMAVTGRSWPPRSWQRCPATGSWSTCTRPGRSTASPPTRATPARPTWLRWPSTGRVRSTAAASRRCARRWRHSARDAASRSSSWRGLVLWPPPSPVAHGSMSAPPFVHLHLHSEYSLADSTIRVGGLVDRCVSLGQPAVALTDLNNLFAAVKFYRKAEGAGIKPILGADVKLADGNEAASRMTLLCRDRDGYLTLSRLLSRMWLEGHRHDGVVLRPDWLRADNNGLFALAGPSSLAGRLAAGSRPELAEAWIADWQQVFD